jgi:hypothetical protein
MTCIEPVLDGGSIVNVHVQGDDISHSNESIDIYCI